ncbi:MAG: (d)CMP kinase [Candidatus Protistobacter heckmanni]|nr:(d)CMP kinase [Candidatus Protistobacter heckmanni]
MIPVIAIDGPTASGKGTVAQLVAQALGYHYLDSGAIYRLAALASLRAGLAADDEPALAALAAGLDIRFMDGQIWLSGESVGDTIRAEEIGNRASAIAVFPALRQALLARQQAFRRAPGLVADGRDMGTVVFPDAGLKVFLTASAEARAQRRYKQLIEKGFPANISTLLQDLKDRDARDANRAAAPLKPAEGASVLDTTEMTVDQAVAQVLAWQAQKTSS